MKRIFIMSIAILVVISVTLETANQFGDDDDAIKLCGFASILAVIFFFMIYERQQEEKNVT